MHQQNPLFAENNARLKLDLICNKYKSDLLKAKIGSMTIWISRNYCNSWKKDKKDRQKERKTLNEINKPNKTASSYYSHSPLFFILSVSSHPWNRSPTKAQNVSTQCPLPNCCIYFPALNRKKGFELRHSSCCSTQFIWRGFHFRTALRQHFTWNDTSCNALWLLRSSFLLLELLAQYSFINCE